MANGQSERNPSSVRQVIEGKQSTLPDEALYEHALQAMLLKKDVVEHVQAADQLAATLEELITLLETQG